MPVVSIDELKQAVIGGHIGAITIDTSVVESHQYGFETGVLSKMSQFSRADTAHLALDIMLHEMRTHLTKEADLVRSQVKNALKPLGNSWGIDKEKRDDALGFLFGVQSAKERAEERIQEFLDNSSATELKCSEFVDLQALISRFIETKPPFGNKESKKYEFPDAIALLALEGWATKNGTSVVVVSSDGDWKGFCVESSHLYYIDDLSHALSAFQADAEAAAALFMTLLQDGKIDGLDTRLLESISGQSDKIDVSLEATSNWYYEPELDQVEVASQIPPTEQIKTIDVLEYEDNILVLQTTLEIDVTAHFIVDFMHWDSIDREYISMGSGAVGHTEALDLDLILTVCFENGNALIESVELLPVRVTMDFGEIEPDWMNDSEEEEEEEDPN